MRIRKDKMVKAIDYIVAEHNRRQEAYDKALVQYERERKAIWQRDMWPRYKKLQLLISSGGRTKVITPADLQAIFAKGHYTDDYRMEPFAPDLAPPPTLKFESGRKVERPTGVNIDQMQAMKKLLEAVEDDAVSDSVLARLGVKDVTPIFRMAVEMGGLLA